MTQRPTRVAISTVVPLWTIHYASDLELAAEHLSRGDDVHILRCDGGLASCAANPTKDRLACSFCRSAQRRGLRTLGLSPANIHTIPPVHVSSEPVAQTTAALRDLGASTSGAGRAAASSLISFVRDPEPDLANHQDLANAMLATADAVHTWTLRTLDRIAADRLYLFNGRFVNALPAATAARKLGIPVIAHERNWNRTGFITRESGSVHGLDELGRLLGLADERVSNEPSARSHAIQWFEGRRYPMTEDPIQSYTFGQLHGKLPAGFDLARKNVAVFVSSEDEFVALPDWQHKFFPTQEDTIAAIAEDPRLDPEVHIWVRVHPNLRGRDNAQTSRLDALTDRVCDRLHLIPADSPVDTYSLVDAANIVVTFGSTVGAEAMYWGTPSVLLSRARYERMAGLIVPHSIEEAIDVLGSDLPPPDREHALGFGSMMTETGHRFVRYRPEDGSTPATFNGRSLRPPVPKLVMLKLAHMFRAARRQLSERFATFRSAHN